MSGRNFQKLFGPVLLAWIIVIMAWPVGGKAADQPQDEGLGSGVTATSIIPDIFIPFESTDAPEYALVVEKSTQKFFIYEYGPEPREVFQTDCSTGKNSGPKTESGDSKTPEGVYFFVKIHEDEELAPIYGIRAFPTDYPNLLDRAAGRTGNSIWLHGTDRPLKPYDSNGCVALENTDLEKVTPYITLNKTPIIILERLPEAASGSARELSPLLARFVKDWNRAVESGTYHDYLSFYDPEYLPDISWWMEWSRIRKHPRISQEETNRTLSIETGKISAFKHGDVIVTLFDQGIGFSGQTIPVGRKKFFLTQKDGGFKIIGEDYQTGDENEKGSENLFILTCRNLREEPAQEDPDMESMVSGWLAAWSSKDISAYGQYYAEDFRSQGMNKSEWLKYKDALNQKYNFIRVTKDNLQVRKTGGQCVVSFIQRYKSDAFTAVGVKQLILKIENGNWKIFQENWKKM
jgi:murein L,D-transpeptidase YafK